MHIYNILHIILDLMDHHGIATKYTVNYISSYFIDHLIIVFGVRDVIDIQYSYLTHMQIRYLT